MAGWYGEIKLPNPVDEKLDEIYADFEANKIRVVNRRDLMWATDMVYHSAKSFIFQDELIEKGVVELLVVGDTRTGKTKTIREMMRHYNMGDYIQGESVSLAGLLGGVDESKGQRFVRYGRLPQNHLGLVVIDEANEMSQELMAKMSGVRSTGYYDLVKIVGRKIPCLVRMVWIANTRSQTTLGEYSFGIEAIPDLIGKPEDIARFDICVGIAQRDVDRESLYRMSKDRAKVVHKYEAKRCHNLVLWAWSRKPEDIVINEATEESILDWSRKIADLFDDSIPLVVETEMRVKIARLAVATAARTLSTDGDFTKLFVLPMHVDSACERLCAVYSSQTLAYDEWSRERKGGGLGSEIDLVMRALGVMGMKALLGCSNVTIRDLNVIMRCDKQDSEEIIRLLLYGNAFTSSKNGHRRLSSTMIDQMKAAIKSSKFPYRPQISLIRARSSDREVEDFEQ